MNIDPYLERTRLNLGRIQDYLSAGNDRIIIAERILKNQALVDSMDDLELRRYGRHNKENDPLYQHLREVGAKLLSHSSAYLGRGLTMNDVRWVKKILELEEKLDHRTMKEVEYNHLISLSIDELAFEMFKP